MKEKKKNEKPFSPRVLVPSFVSNGERVQSRELEMERDHGLVNKK